MTNVEKVVEELKKVEMSGEKGKNNRRFYIKTCLSHGSQNIHTPFELCKEIIEKLKENLEKNGKKLIEQNILVMFNTEFVEVLISDFGVPPEKIMFFTDSLAKHSFVRYGYGFSCETLPKGNMRFGGDGIPNGMFGTIEQMEKNNMKFDCVVMNPPYLGQLHLEFLDKALDIVEEDGTVVCVHPSTWLFSGNKGEKTQKIYGKLKNKISDYEKEFTFFNANKMFGIGMFVPCSITVVNKGKKNKVAKVIDKLQGKTFEYKEIWDVNKFGDYPEYYSLLEKIIAGAKKDNLENHKYNNERKKVEETFSFYVNISRIRGHVSTRNDSIMTIDDFYTFIPRDLEVETENTKKMFFGFDGNNEANNFLNYLKTNFSRFSLSLVKVNSDLDTGDMVLVPYLDFSKEWTDEKLYKLFDLTKEEISFIEKTIPKYY